MKRIFEFKCSNNHITERFIDETIRTCKCSVCSKDAIRIISTPHVSLEGVSGDFPGAADAWVRKRAEKQQQEQKRAASYGE